VNLPYSIIANRWIKKLCMLFACALFFYAGTAQTVSVTADRNKILLGEQITLQLKAEDINTRTSFLENWFALNDSSNHLQVVKKEKIDTIEIRGLTTYLQKVFITSFDSGRWQFAPLTMNVKDKVTGKQTILKTDSIYIEVLPVDVSAMLDYHALKDILDVEAKPDYTLYIIIGGSVIVLLIVIWLFRKMFAKKKLAPPKPVYKGTALEHALQQINELQQQNLPAKNQVKLFYTKLSDICREYFSAQLSIHASQITSDELMITLIVYLQDEKRRTAFYQWLRLTDAVKFAKYIPEAVQNNEAVETAIASLQHIDQLIKQTKAA
jgi:hypothetical protein